MNIISNKSDIVKKKTVLIQTYYIYLLTDYNSKPNNLVN